MKNKLSSPNQPSRRQFLKKASAATGVAIGAGLTATCAVQALPQPSALPSKWDLSADVVVIGSGIAGMSAAITALDLGGSVTVLEKSENYGGCAIINGGILSLGGGTRTQRENGIEDTPELLFKKLTDPTHPDYRKNDPKLVRHYAQVCPTTQEWLEEHGVTFLPTFTKPGEYDSQHHESYHHIGWKDPGEGNRKPQPSGGFMTGRGIMMPYYEWFTSKGGEILMQHRATQVYQDANGRAVGVCVETPDGVKSIQAKRGVVLAGGGWKANRKLRTLTDPRFGENMPSTGYPFVEPDGSAIQLGMKAGAMYVGDRGEDTPHLRRMFGTNRYGFPRGSKYGCPGIDVKGPRWAEVIFTNKNGDRFIREEDKANLGGYSFYDIALAQPEQLLWCIFDDATAKNFRWTIESPQCEEGYAFKAETLEDLANLTNQPNLVKTTHAYNGFVESKKDTEFSKPEELLTKKIEQGPFYAVRLVLFVHNLTGGLYINENAQVLNTNGDVIPALYAAGETAGGLYVGNGMPRGIMPGRFAGEHIMKS